MHVCLQILIKSVQEEVKAEHRPLDYCNSHNTYFLQCNIKTRLSHLTCETLIQHTSRSTGESTLKYFTTAVV